MSEPEQLPRVTLSAFQRVVTDLFVAPIDGAPPIGISVRFRAEGLSMYPAIRHGELITVGPVAGDEIVRGDVLLCRHSNRVLAHRVIAVTGYGSARVLRLRGDAKRGSDAPVASSDVIGKVLSVRRNGRAIPLCGRAARLRHRARSAASRAKAFVEGGYRRLRAIERSGLTRGAYPERRAGISLGCARGAQASVLVCPGGSK